MTMPLIDPVNIAKAASQSFALPEICTRIRAMLDDQTSDLDDLGDLIALDPSLSSKLLKLANSPLFRFESQIDSLSKAINIIGGEALYNLVMIETASTAFEHFSSDVIDLKRFWRQSIYAALVAKHLAKIAKIRGSERFFLLGLLHNLGELLVALNEPNLAIQCNNYDKRICPWQLQHDILGFDYPSCSANLLKHWNLPAQVYQPVEFAHNEAKATQSKEAAIVFTSVRAAIAMSNEHFYSVVELTHPTVYESLALEQEDLQDAVKYALMEAHSVLAIVKPQML